MTIDFGMVVWIETVLLLKGDHCRNNADHYFSEGSYYDAAGQRVFQERFKLSVVRSTDKDTDNLFTVQKWARFYTITVPVKSSGNRFGGVIPMTSCN